MKRDDKNTSAAEKAQKIKKKLIIVLIFIAAVFLILTIAIAVLEKIQAKLESEKEYKGSTHTIIYYEPIEDIFKDSDYLDLNRNVYYTDGKTGVKYLVDEDSKDNFGEGVRLMYDCLQTVIAGDAEAYNEFFGEHYYSLDKKRTPKEHFYMQELYNINIVEEPDLIGEKTDSDGNIYTQYVFRVTFMIHKNNGTYLLMDSDAEKPQIFYITNMSGEFKIDNIQQVSYKY